MRSFILATILLISLASSAQYYYKDIIGTKESAELIKTYMKNKVSRVVLTSFDADNRKDEDFYVEQQFSQATNSLKTITRSGNTNASILISYIDTSGNVIKTVDSSDIIISWTTYNYNAEGQLISVAGSTSDSSKTSEQNEQHLWQWKDGKPTRMLRIKNKYDTIYVDFKLDENGNVIEEQETHKKVKSFPVFYYYNDSKLLTDIASFSIRANQVLPEYMFEYSEKGQVIQKITVPNNSSEYLIWRYQYNGQGLKTKEVIYNKQKKLSGKIEYQYSFGS
jgi:hypothetical protein